MMRHTQPIKIEPAGDQQWQPRDNVTKIWRDHALEVLKQHGGSLPPKRLAELTGCALHAVVHRSRMFPRYFVGTNMHNSQGRPLEQISLHPHLMAHFEGSHCTPINKVEG